MRGLGATALVRDMPLPPAPYRFVGGHFNYPRGIGGVALSYYTRRSLTTYLNGTKVLGTTAGWTFISPKVSNRKVASYREILWLSKNKNQVGDKIFSGLCQPEALSDMPGFHIQKEFSQIEYRKDKNIPECVVGMHSAAGKFTVWIDQILVNSKESPSDMVTNAADPTNIYPVYLGFTFQSFAANPQPSEEPDQFILLQPHEFRYPERLKP